MRPAEPTWLSNASGPFDYVWYWRCRLPERKGTRCRVLVRGGKNTIAVQFEDLEFVFTSRYAVRRGDPVTVPVGDPVGCFSFDVSSPIQSDRQ